MVIVGVATIGRSDQVRPNWARFRKPGSSLAWEVLSSCAASAFTFSIAATMSLIPSLLSRKTGCVSVMQVSRARSASGNGYLVRSNRANSLSDMSPRAIFVRQSSRCRFNGACTGFTGVFEFGG